jgi:hypothetical protein
MTALKSIPIRECKVYRSWSEAPDGAILQLRKGSLESPRLFLKCKIQNGNGSLLPSVVSLEGESGCWLWSGLRSDAAALDVSDYFEIHIEDPAPSPRAESEPIGGVFAHDVGAIFILVGAGQMRGYLCVRPAEKYALGIIYDPLNPANIFDVGRAIVKPIDR